MDHTLSETDLQILERKEALREKDRVAVARGECSWAEMNRANSFGASVIDDYRPVKKLGLPR